MKSALPLGALACVAAVLGATVVVESVLARSDGGTSVRATETFRARTTSLTTIDNGRRGESSGDLLTFTHALSKRGSATRVGKAEGYCVRVVRARSSQCTMTMILAGGQVVVVGTFRERGSSRLAVAGGTGSYADRPGWVDVHRAGLLEFDFEVVLPTR
jgi:hypothetical protein